MVFYNSYWCRVDTGPAAEKNDHWTGIGIITGIYGRNDRFEQTEITQQKRIRMSTIDKEQIPVFKKWRHWYWLVIGFLLVLVVLFYCFTKFFA
ncbi:hypothetical protein A4R26_15305 [Niastella populi]|uniref:Uncharacterized protein n=1 Tax=Niastella populi TaxID=550983 RepID=A0A1V9G377_9BACT|nr:hypothetical protein A4R26_15305 [Niastella populi]